MMVAAVRQIRVHSEHPPLRPYIVERGTVVENSDALLRAGYIEPAGESTPQSEFVRRFSDVSDETMQKWMAKLEAME